MDWIPGLDNDCFVFVFCLIIINIDLQILGHNLLLKFYLHFLMFHSKNTNDAKEIFFISNKSS